ncbi:AAA family ATPase [Candidatus Woesearchaeota archaeon]|nr:AAA family ATPase [Candidatus Woesearchaeota archaeon]
MAGEKSLSMLIAEVRKEAASAGKNAVLEVLSKGKTARQASKPASHHASSLSARQRPKPAKSTKPADSAKPLKSTEPTNHIKPTKFTKPTKSAKPAKPIKSTKSIKSTKTTKPAIIVVSGTPGTGKTTLSRQLAKELKMQHLDVGQVIRQGSLSEGYDPVRRCEIIDVEKLKQALVKVIARAKKGIIIDSHLSHYLPKEHVDLCIITKCNLKVLEGRMKKRGYHREKVRENLDSEIFDICLTEAMEAGHNILVIDTEIEPDIEKIRLRLRSCRG